MLREQACDHDLAVLRGRFLALTSVELVAHPLRQDPLVRLDCRELVRVTSEILRKGIGQLGGERLAALDALGSDAERGRLTVCIVERHDDQG